VHPKALSQAEGALLPADPNVPQVPLVPHLSPFILLSSEWVQFDPLHRIALALNGSPTSRLQVLTANRLYPPSRSHELADEVMRSTHCAAKRSDMDCHATLKDGWCALECQRLISCYEDFGDYPPSSFGIEDSREKLLAFIAISLAQCDISLPKHANFSSTDLESMVTLNVMLGTLYKAMGPESYQALDSTDYMEVEQFNCLAQLHQGSCM
jgi:hypothetical protein